MFRTLYVCLLLTSLAFFMPAQADDTSAQADLAAYVNPFIGTGAVDNSLSGNNYPGATVPFGMVQLSPDTREAPDWAQASGYDYNDSIIYGFSHTRLSGTGASDLIDILFLPVTELRRQSRFTHEEEYAVPGYYKVHLLDNDIQAELTTTTRCGLHRYTYPKDKPHMLYIDLDHSANKHSWGRRIENAQLRVVDAYTIEGYRIITGWAKLRKVYFSVRFSAPITRWEVWNNGKHYVNTLVSNGTDLKGTFTFDTKGEALVCKLGLSAVSIANARENLRAEALDKSFDWVRQEAYDSWNNALQKIDLSEGSLSREDMQVFYTALYHTMTQPNTFSDVNGEFMTPDYSVAHVKEGHTQYTTFSLWDTYRAAHPLYTLIAPQQTADFVNSMLTQYQYYGYLPVWQLWGQDNYCMIGNHAVPVIVDAVLKGFFEDDSLGNASEESLYQAVKASLTTPHLNSPFDIWDKYGYMPEDLQSQSVSITLEACFDDWCAAQFAKRMGDTASYDFFMKRASNYRNLFHPEQGFFQPKNSEGKWILPFDPYKYGANGGYPFTEGNAWQYYWYVPHQVEDLIDLSGGRKAFCRKLDEFFTSTQTSGAKNDNASGFVGLYAHGNEPSHHVAYLYALAGQSQKTEQLVNHIARTLYNTSSSGYAGNDDCGEMSAWYVFSALGFYPLNPVGGSYVLGSPLVDKAVLHLPSGKQLRIEVERPSREAIYVKSVRFNGKPCKQAVIHHEDLLQGGVLRFVMTSKPSGPILASNLAIF